MDSGYYYVNELSYLPTKYIRKIEESLDCILKEVPDVREVYLFGSCARGDYKWNSDVDIAVITDETITDHALRGNVSCALDEYSEEGVRADVIFLLILLNNLFLLHCPTLYKIGFPNHQESFEMFYFQLLEKTKQLFLPFQLLE